MTYSEALEIMRYVQKKTGKPVYFTQAMVLAQFSFPLEEKLRVIDVVCTNKDVYSLRFFLEPFRKAESDYHKGSPPIKEGNMTRISDILGIKNDS